MELNSKNIYNNLIILWQAERNSENICRLNDHDFELLIQFQKQIHSNNTQMSNSEKDTENIHAEIISELKNQSSAMIDYFINDLLNIRQNKIIKYCKNLEIIDSDHLTTLEHDFYDKFMAAYRGYNKMRNMYNVSANVCDSEPIVEENIPFCQNDDFRADRENIEYVLVRIIDQIPSLVGFDFNTYGPFKKEDVAKIPKINAIILEKENLIEIIG